MRPVELIEECRSGIAQISLENERERIGSKVKEGQVLKYNK